MSREDQVVLTRANDHAALGLLASKTPPRARTLQAWCDRICRQARTPARCGAAASWRLRSRAL